MRYNYKWLKYRFSRLIVTSHLKYPFQRPAIWREFNIYLIRIMVYSSLMLVDRISGSVIINNKFVEYSNNVNSEKSINESNIVQDIFNNKSDPKTSMVTTYYIKTTHEPKVNSSIKDLSLHSNKAANVSVSMSNPIIKIKNNSWLPDSITKQFFINSTSGHLNLTHPSKNQHTKVTTKSMVSNSPYEIKQTFSINTSSASLDHQIKNGLSTQVSRSNNEEDSEDTFLSYRPIVLNNAPPSFIPPSVPLKYLTIYVGYGRHNPKPYQTINIGLLLPQSCDLLSCLSKIAPAIRIAFRRSKVESLISGFTINIIQADSNCSNIEGPLAAIRLCWFENVVVIFGPVCDYVVDPVSILTSRFFSIPLITAGAFNPEYGRDKKLPNSPYPLLTRVGAPFNSIFSFLIKFFRYNRWKKFFVLYEVNSHPQIISNFCFHVVSGMANSMYNSDNMTNPQNFTYKNGSSKNTFNSYHFSHKTEDIQQMRNQNKSYSAILEDIAKEYGS
ncbi:unnamed protein product [Gordionus sp. m RMFG-2023]